MRSSDPVSRLGLADKRRSHKWRNVGIIFAFMIGLCAVYMLASGEYSTFAFHDRVISAQMG